MTQRVVFSLVRSVHQLFLHLRLTVALLFSLLRHTAWLMVIALLLSGCPSLRKPQLTISGFNYLPTSPKSAIVAHTHFVLSYAEAHEQAEWVAYELTPEEVRINIPRDGNFREDPNVPTGSASPDDYRGSGYDRGHLAPVGDMNFDPVAMEESFLMSNISPQNRSFNAGIWIRLENQVRDWSAEQGGLYVITGPVLSSTGGTNAERSIGENQVTVPEFFYKVLLYERGSDSRMIGFVLPNRANSGDLRAFVEKVDNIEAYTGIDFFPTLTDSLEERLECEVNLEGWF